MVMGLLDNFHFQSFSRVVVAEVVAHRYPQRHYIFHHQDNIVAL
jgi:hypothetical protein